MGGQQSILTKSNGKSNERIVFELLGSGIIEGIGEDSSIWELSSLPFLFREFHDDCMKKLFDTRPVGTLVVSFGANHCGQLGLGKKNSKNKPEIVSALTGLKIIQICCGSAHSIVLLETGEILSWGFNRYGQLGLGDTKDRSIPTKIGSLNVKHAIEISCLHWHNCAITEDGSVYSWGDNRCGQLGLADSIQRNSPTLISSLNGLKASKVFCCCYQSFILLENTEVFGCGWNHNGQLGVGDRENRCLPTLIPSLAQKSLSGSHIISISGGEIYSLALTGNGEVLFAGNKGFNVGLTDLIQDKFEIVKELAGKVITSIACGGSHCFALHEIGDLYVWGRNQSGRLGLGYEFDVALQPSKITALNNKNVIKVSCGGFGNHNFAIIKDVNDFRLFGWGSNDSKQLGNTFFAAEEQIPVQLKIPSFQGKSLIDIICGEFFTLLLLS